MAILKSPSSIDSDMSLAEESEMVSLSDDLIADIILRLPVRSVARSMCVSKNWCATISDDYLRHRLPLFMSLVYFPDDPARGKAPRFACAAGGGSRLLEDCGLGFFPFLEGAVVCDACNGLLLFRSPGTPRFYVVDPVTRRWVALPRPSRDAQLSMLAFDPFSSRSYHVINFTGWRERGATVEVFSSETWAWTARDAEFGVPAGSLSGSMHFHDGAVYVLASDPDFLVRMDVADPELACTAVALPEPMDGDGRVAHSGGRLHYVSSYGELLKVWALDDSSTRQWRLKHTVKVDDVVEGECRGSEIRFLALHPEKDAVYMWSPWKLVEYDLTMKEITGAWEFGGKDQNSEKNRIVKTSLVPSSLYLSDCLADGHVQC
ncbi:putative F-box protein At5g52610 [Phragmites australis]|uniref:putative F-box protein At5g52610 n=1 Tax=Phragmites australis TaxID=29695 RepID=UPI002D78E532|nr:putative F-box protein At5g52610 [Phragmites australis]